MHLIFERSNGRIRSNSNILALAWMPYYVESRFRQALLDYHQKQLMNLGRAQQNHRLIGINNNSPLVVRNASNHHATDNNNNYPGEGESRPDQQATRAINLVHLVDRIESRGQHGAPQNTVFGELQSSGVDVDRRLAQSYGKLTEFGWLVVGNVGKTISVTLTSTIEPPREIDNQASIRPEAQNPTSIGSSRGKHDDDEDLMLFDDDAAPDETNGEGNVFGNPQSPTRPSNGAHPEGADFEPHRRQFTTTQTAEFERLRPDRRSKRSNYNLGGHLDEVILVRWNELYQKLATVDSKGNVLIWCKINEKFSVQTPFYNRTKSVADFRWSNDGKTALICYTDSFILIGSSSGQRHWHSMLNLDEYHITCASWTPNDDQLLLGVSNGNVVVIDLPQSELIELVVSRVNIRTICWSSYEMNLNHLAKVPFSSVASAKSSSLASTRTSGRSRPQQFNSEIVNQRRLDRDCSLFSRYRFCSQAPSEGHHRVVAETGLSRTDDGERICPPDGQDGARLSGHGDGKPAGAEQKNILAIEFANNTIKLYDGGLEDHEPKLIHVNLESFIMAWSTDGRYLAVAGFNIHTSAMSIDCLRCRYLNSIKFYNQSGELVYQYTMRYTRYPITAFTWAHDDRRIFVATGPRLHCAKLFQGVPKLSLLAMSRLHHETRLPDKFDVLECLIRGKFSAELLNWQSFNCPIETRQQQERSRSKTFECSDRSSSLTTEDSNEMLVLGLKTSINNANVLRYELPLKLKLKLDELFAQTIRKPIDDQLSLTDIVWHVPKYQQRYHCTLICYTNDLLGRDTGSFSQQYRNDLLERKANSQATDQYKVFVLYLEFEGSLIPILRARRIGYLKPEFVLFDPEDVPIRCLQRSHRVSDMSNQAFINGRSEPAGSSNPSGLNQQQLAYYQEAISGGLVDNCSELHSYTPSANDTNEQSYCGRNPSLSSAEHYYNFDQCDSKLRQQTQQDKLASNLRSLGQSQAMMDPYLLYLLISSQQNKCNNLNPPVPGHSSARRAYKKSSNNNLHDELRHVVDRYRSLSRHAASSTTNHSRHLPETNELVRIRSNVWGTKFKIINMSNRMISQRVLLGTVNYKASILHLQPRQIFLTVRDMSSYCSLCSTIHHGNPSSPLESTNRSRSARIRHPARPDDGLGRSTASSSSNKRLNKMRGDERTSVKSTPVRHEQIRDENKIVLMVGDSLKIAPKLEPNQKYKQLSKSQQAPDSQLPSTSKADHLPYGNISVPPQTGRRKPAGHCTPDRDRSSRTKFGPPTSYQRNSQRRLTGPRESDSSQSSSNWHRLVADCSRWSSATPFQSTSSDNDDILTLSLCQGDKVKVEMSSLSQIDAARAEHVVDNLKPSGSANKQLNEFLDSNKTLKSIQTITKMIVDLSSRATNIDDSDDNIDASERLPTGPTQTDPSPSKLLRMSSPLNGASNDNRISTRTQSISSRFIPPETPVHRPRKTNSAMGSDCSSRAHQLKSQSAHSTPLRSMARSGWFRNQQTTRQQLDNSDGSLSGPMVELPPPPQPVPIGRRISSSAKRFLDGSLRSLYGATGGLAGRSGDNDPEPGEYEPLVSSGGNSFGASCTRQFQSQPNTPRRRHQHVREAGPASASSRSNNFSLFAPTPTTTGRGQHNQPAGIDLSSLRDQLLERVRSSATNWRSSSTNVTSINGGELDAVGGPPSSSVKQANGGPARGQLGSRAGATGWKAASRSCSRERAEGLPSFQHRNQTRQGLAGGCHHQSGRGHSDDDDFGSSSSADSCTDDDNEPHSGRELAGGTFKPDPGRLSFSAKTLNDLTDAGARLARHQPRLAKQNNGQQEQKKRAKQRHSRRQARRKSICLNANCCCANEFKLNNRPPVWNDQSQVYQLDFGGRVTQESAKNLQIDFDGNLALQFGRIDQCTYTLDFKHPFNAVQAMSIALASLTQRMK